jgi:hypothetical protein
MSGTSRRLNMEASFSTTRSPARAIGSHEAIFAAVLSFTLLVVSTIYADMKPPAPIASRAVIGFFTGMIYMPVSVVGYNTFGSLGNRRKLAGDAFRLDEQFRGLSRRVHEKLAPDK